MGQQTDADILFSRLFAHKRSPSLRCVTSIAQRRPFVDIKNGRKYLPSLSCRDNLKNKKFSAVRETKTAVSGC
jgi:hypothetical protein